MGEDRIGKDIKLFFGGNAMTHKAYINNGYVGKVKWNMAMLLLIGPPEDVEDKILNSKQEAEEASKAYAKAQDELKQTEIQAYATEKYQMQSKSTRGARGKSKHIKCNKTNYNKSYKTKLIFLN